MTQQFIFYMLLIISATTLSGCTPAGPAGAAQQYFEASMSGNADRAADLACEAQKANVRQSVKPRPADTQRDFSGVKYSVGQETSDSATVRVSGQFTAKGGNFSANFQITGTVYQMKNENGWKYCGETR